MSFFDPLASPALSATSNMSSAIDLFNNASSSAPGFDESDDEIIYNIPEAPSLSANEFSCSTVISDDDFVVLSRPISQRGTLETESSSAYPDDNSRLETMGITELTTGLANLSVTPAVGRRRHQGKVAQNTVAIAGTVGKKKQKKKKKKSQPQADFVTSLSSRPSPQSQRAATTKPVVKEKSSMAKSKPKKKKVQKQKSNGSASRSLVDDVSDHRESDIGSPSMYEEAFNFITSFLSNPAARNDPACRLTLLQSLIIELGLANSSLPCSLSAAKAYLKSRAFLNINEYIAVRDQGPAAVRRIMYPSRTALMKEIRKNNKSKAPRGWVKDIGLQVLLVQCYH